MDIRVRRYAAADRAPVIALAPRLGEGVAPWRDPVAVRAAVTKWVETSLARSGEPARLVLVAESAGELVGFVTAEERRHWCGDRSVYVGELVVAHEAEGRGIGRALMRAVTEWAGDRRVPHVTLETGAANEAARAFYQRLGFLEEDVRLTLAVSRRPA